MSFSSRFIRNTPPAVLGLAALAGVLGSPAQAQTTWSTNPQAVQTQQQAKAQFDADKKLCADEASRVRQLKL